MALEDPTYSSPLADYPDAIPSPLAHVIFSYANHLSCSYVRPDVYAVHLPIGHCRVILSVATSCPSARLIARMYDLDILTQPRAITIRAERATGDQHKRATGDQHDVEPSVHDQERMPAD